MIFFNGFRVFKPQLWAMTRKKTREKFIEQAELVHGKRYDYSKVEYVNNITKVCIVCLEHGEFFQTPSSHINCHGCPDCAIHNRAVLKTDTKESFVEKAVKIHGQKYIYSNSVYLNSATKIGIVCLVHGEFFQKPESHIQGQGCRGCQYDKLSAELSDTKEEFVDKCEKIHGQKYNYSKSVYINCFTKVCIGCPFHGDFFQTPGNHIYGQGCPDCGIESSSAQRSETKEEFIEKAETVHGKKYDYTHSVYVNSFTKVCIGCPTHGEFFQAPFRHKSGQGCPDCAIHNRAVQKTDTKDSFVEKSERIHSNKYEYTNVVYVNSSTKVSIICPIHGEFLQTPNSHLVGYGCMACGICASTVARTYTKEEFFEKARNIHGDLYEYSSVDYVNMTTEVDILCWVHGLFQQKPFIHIQGHGCQACGVAARAALRTDTKEEFIEKAEKVHGKKYDYTHSVYVNSFTKVCIGCPTHGEFFQAPACHNSGQGCPRCTHRGYSKVQIEWLNFVALYYGLDIQHAENGGEFDLPATRYSADGYCQATNTVYEFHGDFWHGNPARFDPSAVNVTNKKTFGELYAATLAREAEIKQLGYQLVVMWQYQWIKINRAVKQLQRAFKCRP